MKTNTDKSLLVCSCENPEHQIIFYKDKNFSDDYREVLLSLHLTNYRNIFKRILVSIKYIFGYESKYGVWDTIIITKDNYFPLKDAVNFIEEKD